jgi:hypothetical protein
MNINQLEARDRRLINPAGSYFTQKQKSPEDGLMHLPGFQTKRLSLIF